MTVSQRITELKDRVKELEDGIHDALILLSDTHQTWNEPYPLLKALLPKEKQNDRT